MADINNVQTPKLDGTGLSQVWAAILENFAKKTDYETLKGIVDGLGALAAKDKIAAGDLEAALASTISGKADAGSVYTKTEVDQKVAGVYKVKGSLAFADMPAADMEEGDVYNITDAFETTDSFTEGTGKKYPAGTNVVYTSSGRWDCLAGVYDFSDFVRTGDLRSLTNEEIAAICVMPAAGDDPE